MKKTKIICTIGPSSDNEEKIEELIKNGMDVARLNLSHNNHNYHQKVIKKIRKIAEKLDKPIPIITDLQGPKLRLGSFPEKILIKPQTSVILNSSYEKIDNKNIIKVPIIYSNLYKYIQIKDKIILGDNQIELEVKKINNREIICSSLNEGFIFSNMGFNISSEISFKIPILTKKDVRDIKFSVENDIDFIALSFVASENDLIILRKLINKYQNKKNSDTIKIIAKIERGAAIENIDKIIIQSDVIMIARGDLGIEVPIERVPLIQKTIIQKCLNQSKPVIVATQMLSSMQNKPSPTRAEVSDIANAVIDQADALMLSEETAVGIYPIKAVKVMNKTIIQAEKFEDEQFFKKLTLDKEENLMSIDDSLIFGLNLISQKIKAKLILIVSLTGYTGRIISRFRLNIPLFVFTCKKKIARQLNLNWGLFPLTVSNKNLCSLSEKIQQNTINHFLNKGIVKKKDVILIVGRKDRQYLSSIDWIEIRHI